MMAGDGLVFLLDVDNTLLDTDRFTDELGDRLEQFFGAAHRARYFAIFAELRERLGLADYLGSLQAFRTGLDDDPRLLRMSEYLLEYPFAQLIFPGALAAIAQLASSGTVVILSDGDVVYQPRKIQRSGLWDAVGGRVLIYLHKEQSVEHVLQRYPAKHYVMVDDKPNLLAAMKTRLAARLTTVFVRQGHYALAKQPRPPGPSPDRCIDSIAALSSLDFSALLS